MHLYRNSVLPLYYQLSEVLRQQIEGGDLKVNDRIPSERELMATYGISRNTVRQAIDTLVHEGLLRQEQGRGTFVAVPRVQLGLLRLTSFSEDMMERGLRPGARLLELAVTEPPTRIATALELNSLDEVIKIVRLRFANDEPMAINTSFLPYKLCPDLVHEPLNRVSLYRLLEGKYGFRLSRGEQFLKPVVATAEEARLLKVKPGAPLLLQEGTIFLDDDRPLEYLKALYRGDRYEFTIAPVRSP